MKKKSVIFGVFAPALNIFYALTLKIPVKVRGHDENHILGVGMKRQI